MTDENYYDFFCITSYFCSVWIPYFEPRRFHGDHVPVGPVTSTNVSNSYRVLLLERVDDALQVCWCGDVWGCETGKYVRVATIVQEGIFR